MSERASSRRLLVLGALALLGCDGVGRALVGERLDVGDDLTCQRPSCQDRPRPIAPRELASEPLGVAYCPQAPDAPVCGPAGESGALADDALVDLCGEARVLDEYSGDTLRELACARLSLRRTAEAGGGVLRISDARWKGLTLVIETEQALVLELERAVLAQVRVTLRGPVTLRVVDSPEVSELMITTADRAAGLELRGSRVGALWLGTGESPLAGAVDVQRSTIAALTAFVRAASFESVLLEDVRVSAERVELSDTTGRRLLLSADQFVLNVSNLSEIEIERCGRLAAYQTWLTSFRVPACSDDATRLYGGSQRRGTIEGQIVADRASFDRTRFGVLDATELLLWDSSLKNSSLCAGTSSMQIAGETSSLCVFCREDDGSPVPVQACRHPESGPILLETCPALVNAPVCVPPPERMRPPL